MIFTSPPHRNSLIFEKKMIKSIVPLGLTVKPRIRGSQVKVWGKGSLSLPYVAIPINRVLNLPFSSLQLSNYYKPFRLANLDCRVLFLFELTPSQSSAVTATVATGTLFIWPITLEQIELTYSSRNLKIIIILERIYWTT